jgi:hypothetical protein
MAAHYRTITLRPMRKGMESRKQPATILIGFPPIKRLPLQGNVNKHTTLKAPRQNRPQSDSPTSTYSETRVAEAPITILRRLKAIPSGPVPKFASRKYDRLGTLDPMLGQPAFQRGAGNSNPSAYLLRRQIFHRDSVVSYISCFVCRRDPRKCSRFGVMALWPVSVARLESAGR